MRLMWGAATHPPLRAAGVLDGDLAQPTSVDGDAVDALDVQLRGAVDATLFGALRLDDDTVLLEDDLLEVHETLIA